MKIVKKKKRKLTEADKREDGLLDLQLQIESIYTYLEVLSANLPLSITTDEIGVSKAYTKFHKSFERIMGD